MWLRADVLVLGVCAALALYLKLKGPTRGLKLALAAFVAVFVALQAASFGGLRGLSVLGVLVAVNVVSMLVATQMVSNPVAATLQPLPQQGWPRFARGTLDGFTAELGTLGFEPCGDGVFNWKMGGATKRSFVRVFRHATQAGWAEVQALEDPKLVARSFTSLKTGGSVSRTVDKQANEEFFADPLTRIQRVASRSSCGQMWAAHQTLVGQSPGTWLPVADPHTVRVETHDGWIRRMSASGQIRVKGELWRVPLRQAVPVMLRVMGAWFH